ncbi:MAG: universal stress protein [Proteobacteria bacterium]|nr:universal stress protein [Pseudomonadota bacterium]MCL2307119.1 universal stress protein [Pseudomonadota bacterium]
MYKNLLVATDGSPLSDKAIDQAIDLAVVLKAKLYVFYASPSYPLPAYAGGVVYEPISKKEFAAFVTEEAEKILSAAEERIKKAKVECGRLHVLAATPWEAILDAAKENNCDLIVMASHGRRGISAMLLGSETQKVLTHSSLPVLVIR